MKSKSQNNIEVDIIPKTNLPINLRKKELKKLQMMSIKNSKKTSKRKIEGREVVINSNGINDDSIIIESVLADEIDKNTSSKTIAITPSELTKAILKIENSEKILGHSITIEERVKKVVKKNKDKLSTIKEELDNLDNGINDIHKPEDIKHKKEQLIAIDKKIKILNTQFSILKTSDNFIDFSLLEDEELLLKIAEFKNKGTYQDVKSLLSECKKAVGNLEILHSAVDKATSLEVKINDKNQELDVRNKVFKEQKSVSEQEKENLLLMQSILGDQIKKAESLLRKLKDFDDIKDELSNEQLKKFTSHLGATTSAFSIITKLLNLLTLNMFKGKVDSKEQLLSYIYSEQVSVINNEINGLNGIACSINDNLKTIDSLIHRFEIELFKYKYFIKDYDELYSKLLDMQVKIKDMDNKVNQAKDVMKDEKEKIKRKIY